MARWNESVRSDTGERARKHPRGMTAAQAEELLDGPRVIPALAGSIPEMKALRDRCLAEGIPALLGRPPGAGKG